MTKITIERKVLEQALDALVRNYSDKLYDGHSATAASSFEADIAAIKELAHPAAQQEHDPFLPTGARIARGMRALAAAQPTEPAAQPVAYMTEDGRVAMRGALDDCMPNSIKKSFSIPLYTRPAVPLSDEQIKQVFDNLPSAHEKAWFIRYARAIEAAHKIGNQP
jgi:hypothetical protein